MNKIKSFKLKTLVLVLLFMTNLYAQEIHLKHNEEYVEMPEDFPFKVVWLLHRLGAVHSYTIYDNENNKVAVITRPLNKYQATNRKGKELEVVGFYKNGNNEYLIERLTYEGVETASCNACQTSNIETFKVTSSGIESINVRKFDIETYEQYR